MNAQANNSIESYKPSASALLWLAFFRNRARHHGKCQAWIPRELARRRGINYVAFQRDINSLVDAGLLQTQCDGPSTSYIVLPTAHKLAMNNREADALRPFLTLLKEKCARTGSYSGNRATIAKELRLTVGAIAWQTARLKKKKLITVKRRRGFAIYTVVGLRGAISSEEPSPLSVQGKILHFMRASLARSQSPTFSRTHSIIAKAIQRSVTTVNRNMVKMRESATPFITLVSNGRPNTYTVARAPADLSKQPRRRPNSEPAARSEIVARLKVIRGFTHKQFAADADIEPHQWRDWRRKKAHKDDGVIDLKIRDAAKDWLRR